MCYSSSFFFFLCRPVQLPAEDASQIFNQNPFFSHPDTQDAYYGPVLPNSAIAGLIRDEALLFRVTSALYLTGNAKCYDCHTADGCKQNPGLKASQAGMVL